MNQKNKNTCKKINATILISWVEADEDKPEEEEEEEEAHCVQDSFIHVITIQFHVFKTKAGLLIVL